MKLKEFLFESPTDVVARFYVEASKSCDEFFNSENVRYKEKNSEYYDKHFKEWFAEDIVPVFTKPTTAPQPLYTNKPDKDKLQSPGYRGLQYARAASNLPYDRKVQRHEPNAAKILATQSMDAAKNNNGQ